MLNKTNPEQYSLEEAVQEIVNHKKIMTMLLKQTNKECL
jgi:hypothetical protein